ncbi:hypothetical protein VPAG_00056 [Vibrio phage douglas 12A4]|uniref:hypothetical protein n=1 Tax=Vibrio phage douglas 12A4 TaxID=573171 RepID=UPI0002C0C4CD|nr:hypothetical protein VPAG_00056 [Vibrio phage douglas 12A4]AGG58092.1 hypothetical protein VPAG_00056 [Vibrio phage douglas 12A4]
MKQNEFYVTSRHGLLGTNVVFENKDHLGYGTDLDKLHIYTLEQAQNEANYSREWLCGIPLLKSAVDARSIRAVDHQYLPEEWEDDENNQYVLQIPGYWNGNDIKFTSHFAHLGTFDYSEARIYTKEEAELIIVSTNFVMWPKSVLDSISRRTFQVDNVSTRKMITGAGIKYKRPRPRKPRTGKTRHNCPLCGRINWQYDPEYFDSCSSSECIANDNHPQNYKFDRRDY